jgi:hypothetical protein
MKTFVIIWPTLVELSIDDVGRNITSILKHKTITGGERAWRGKCVSN